MSYKKLLKTFKKSEESSPLGAAMAKIRAANRLRTGDSGFFEKLLKRPLSPVRKHYHN